MKTILGLLTLLLVACGSPEYASDPAALDICPTTNPKNGDSCVQYASGYQCGPCVCTANKWSCPPRADGGCGAVTCPASAPKNGDACTHFPSGWQCGPCVCSAAMKWTCVAPRP